MTQQQTSPRRGWTKPIIAVVLLIAVVAMMASFLRSDATATSTLDAHDDDVSTPDQDSKLASAIHVSVVRAGQVATPETYSRYRGTVQSRRESQLGFRRGGRVQQVDVSEGDSVKAGQVLAQLDVADVNAQRDQALAQLNAARATLNEAEVGPRKQTIEAAIADVNRFSAELRSAQADFDREALLRRRGAGTGRGFDNARFAVDRIKALLSSAKARRDELQEGTRIEQIEAAKAAVAVAKAAVLRIDVDLADSQIVAPYDGQIAARLVDEGTIVGPDAIALRLIESPPLEARFGLPDSVAQRMNVGDVTKVESPLGRMSAEVIRIHPVLDLTTRTRSIDVRFSADADLVPGQTVTLPVAATAMTRDSSDVRFWVPTTALARSSRGLWSVMVAVPQTDDQPVLAVIERRDVRVMQTSGDYSEVTGMIKRGDAIVSSGTHRIGPGVNVIVAEDSRSPDQLAAAHETNQP